MEGLTDYRAKLHRVFDGDFSSLENVFKEASRLFRLRNTLIKENNVRDFASAGGHIPDQYQALLMEIQALCNDIMQKLNLPDMNALEMFMKSYEDLCKTGFSNETNHKRFVDKLLAETINDHVNKLFGDEHSRWNEIGSNEIRSQFNDALRLALDIAPTEITPQILIRQKPWQEKGNLLRGAGITLQQKRYETRATALSCIILQQDLA